MPRWWDTLLGRSEPDPNDPLNGLETLEDIRAAVIRMEQRHQRELGDLRFEWSETLDKLTSLAARASARQRKRSQRELERLEEEEVETAPPPPPELLPPVAAGRPSKLAIIQAQIEARRRSGAH